jgi:carbamoyltransferase
MVILGLNAYHADAAVALVKDGILVSAIEEERLNRQKHCAGFPTLAVRAALEQAGVRPDEIDHIAVSRDPNAHLFKKVWSALQRPDFLAKAMDRVANLGKVAGATDELSKALGAPVKATVYNVGHHRSHIASAFYPSGFEEAAVLSMDGFGDYLSAMRAVGRGIDLAPIDEVTFPHSAGLFFTAVTQFLGFHKYGEEWKMMGLAPYGKPTHVERLRKLIRPAPGGQYELDTSYFVHTSDGVDMSWR